MRFTLIFLGLLGLATLAVGLVYQNAVSLVQGHGNVWNMLAFIAGGLLLAFTTLILSRLIYLTAPKRVRGEVRS